MLDMSEVITDPDFAKEYNVYRSSGYFGEGGWIENDKTTLSVTGPILPTNSKDLQQVPEGDRIIGNMTFYSTIELFETRNGDNKGTSDELEWKGELYKIIKMLDFSDYGYYKAITARITGD
jgi:hypothetical protein